MQKKSVVRVLMMQPGATTKHITIALNAFLTQPVSLPRDPGAGPYPVTVRLDLADVDRGMASARELNRAAFLRRICLWYFAARIRALKQSLPSPPARPGPVRTAVPAPKNLSDQEYIRRLYERKN